MSFHHYRKKKKKTAQLHNFTEMEEPAVLLSGQREGPCPNSTLPDSAWQEHVPDQPSPILSISTLINHCISENYFCYFEIQTEYNSCKTAVSYWTKFILHNISFSAAASTLREFSRQYMRKEMQVSCLQNNNLTLQRQFIKLNLHKYERIRNSIGLSL